MNKITQNLFQVIYPFYPLWAWISLSFLHFPPDKILIILLLPILIHIIWKIKMMVPAYLVFFILFTLFHLVSVFYNNLVPSNTTWYLFIFSDTNVLACLLFLVIENTNFDEGFITKMNRNILLIIALSLVVSIIQVKNQLFFFNTGLEDEDLAYSGDNRNASIYSWLGSNSVAVTFPILLSILLSVYDFKSKPFPLISISGIIVSFLTRARVVMISSIMAFLQLLLVKTIPLKKKIYVIAFFVAGILLLIGISQMAGFDINKIINERILEKDNEMGSAKARILSYDVFMMKFPENPYFGVGPKTRNDVIDLLGGDAPIIHVGYLSYLYYYGFFGAVLLFLALLFLMKDAWIIGKEHGFWGAFYGLLGFAIANITFVYFNFSEMGIILAVIYMRYYKVYTYVYTDR